MNILKWLDRLRKKDPRTLERISIDAPTQAIERPLTGSRDALFRLFEGSTGLAANASWRMPKVARQIARQERLHRYQWALRQQFADKWRERFGNGHKPALANARKRERQAAR